MIADGYSLEKVRELLEHAENFTYKGKTYHWPSAGFKIKGEIPEREDKSEKTKSKQKKAA